VCSSDLQLQQADLLLVNQTDRIAPAALADLGRWLEAQAPGVPRAECAQAQVPADLVLGLDAPEAGLATTGGRYRPPMPASDRFRYFEREVAAPVDPHAFAAALASPAEGLLRAKGVVTGLDGRRWLVQVMGRRWDVSPVPAAAPAGRVVCIARA
jgi:G3E family GTPase